MNSPVATSTLKTFREPATGRQCRGLQHGRQRIASGAPDRPSDGAAGDLVVRDAATGTEVFARRGLTGGIHAIAFSPDGRWLGVAYGPTLGIWDAATGREHLTKLIGSNTIDGLAFSPDSRRILAGAGGDPGFAMLWDVATGEQQGDPIRCYGGPGGDIACVAISPDGRQAAVTSAGRVDVWDLETRKTIHTLRGHEGFVYAVAFSPDGRHLVSGGLDSTVRLWDRATGAEVRRYPGHQGFVRGVAFSPDGRRIASVRRGQERQTLVGQLRPGTRHPPRPSSLRPLRRIQSRWTSDRLRERGSDHQGLVRGADHATHVSGAHRLGQFGGLQPGRHERSPPARGSTRPASCWLSGIRLPVNTP